MHHHVSLPALLLLADVGHSTHSATPPCHAHLISVHHFHLLLPVFKPLLDIHA